VELVREYREVCLEVELEEQAIAHLQKVHGRVLQIVRLHTRSDLYMDRVAKRRLLAANFVHVDPPLMTDDDARDLRRMTGLYQLVLIDGLSSEAFLSLASLPRLRRIDLWKADKITDADIEAFRKLRPDVVVERVKFVRSGDAPPASSPPASSPPASSPPAGGLLATGPVQAVKYAALIGVVLLLLLALAKRREPFLWLALYLGLAAIVWATTSQPPPPPPPGAAPAVGNTFRDVGDSIIVVPTKPTPRHPQPEPLRPPPPQA
jgi:hypothetical protein